MVIVGLAFAFSLWECGSRVYTGFYQGWVQSATAGHHFHQQLNAEEYEQIYAEADSAFQDPQKHDNLVKFLTKVHTKLGDATSERVTNISLEVNAGGHFVVATYISTFQNGPVKETITWKRNGNQLKLWRYFINSDALVTN